MPNLKLEASRCITELKMFISIMSKTIESFYGLEELLKIRLCKEQLENYCTAIVLDDVVYIFMYNLITLSQLE